jgi:hypothetical protein
MRYRAIAVASDRSNAVGTVELECSPHGLFVAYLGVGAFSEGYAPGALTRGTGLTVPWDSISEARVEGEQVLVAFDHRLTPLNRLLLMNFTTGRALPPEELARRRLVVRLAAVSAAFAAALIITASLLRGSPEIGAGAAIFVAVLAAAALVGLGYLVDRNLAESSDERESLSGFSIELGQYLPALIHLPRPPEPQRKLPEISDLQGLLPRTTLAIVITLTAGALGVLLVARWVTTNESAVARVTDRMLEGSPGDHRPGAAPAPPEALPPGPAPAAKPAESPHIAAATPPRGDGAPLGAECACERADSLLWTTPIPKLSLLVLGQRVRKGRGPDERRGKNYTELDLAVVNNSSQPIGEVALLVLFFERDPPPSQKRSQVDNRPLFFEGPLLPGQAIKWSVEAEGTEFEVENPFRGDIGPNGEEAAPTNRIAELLEARNRPVRLHGAMLLAFLGDPRAKEGAMNLREALREDEAPFLGRLLQSQADLRVCQLHVAGTGGVRAVSACIQNASARPQSDIGIKLRGLDGALNLSSPVAAPPTVLAEATFRVTGDLSPRAGRSVKLAFDLADKRPDTFEAYADQYHLIANQ